MRKIWITFTAFYSIWLIRRGASILLSLSTWPSVTHLPFCPWCVAPYSALWDCSVPQLQSDPPIETCHFFTLLTLDLKAPPDLLSRKIFDHTLSNSNKWARGAAVEVLSLIRKVFQTRCEWPADKNSALSWVWVCWWKKIIVWKMILLKWCCVFTRVTDN